MIGSLSQLRCCEAYLRMMGENVAKRSPSAAEEKAGRVVIAEFRDDFFADLRCLLEAHGWEVARAVSGTAVAYQVKKFVPDLLLVNERMPDESGHLITSKLRLTYYRKPVWLYTARPSRLHTIWKDVSGVDEILVYDGFLSQLVRIVRHRLELSKNNLNNF